MNDRERLLDLLQRYFDGLYRANADELRCIFHPQARLYGEVKGQVLLRELESYLQLMAGRTSPMQKGEEQRMKVLSLQLHGAIALATVQVEMLGFNYINQLSLLKQDEHWFIVSKLYTHLEG